MDLNISISKNIDYVIISFSGKIDIGYYNLFLKKLNDALLSGRKNILMDFSAATFISSMGISAILEAKNYTVNNGGKFIISGLNNKIRQVFDLIGVLNLLDVCDTIEEAVLKLPEASLRLTG
jgi:anti-sigma B factor antagonist